MSRWKEKHPKDANHDEIAKAFKRLGFYVHDIHTLGKSSDLIVHKEFMIGKNDDGEYITIKQSAYIEIKDGSKPPSAQKLTPAEKVFKDEIEAYANYYICRTLKDVKTITKDLELRCAL